MPRIRHPSLEVGRHEAADARDREMSQSSQGQREVPRIDAGVEQRARRRGAGHDPRDRVDVPAQVLEAIGLLARWATGDDLSRTRRSLCVPS